MHIWRLTTYNVEPNGNLTIRGITVSDNLSDLSKLVSLYGNHILYQIARAPRYDDDAIVTEYPNGLVLIGENGDAPRREEPSMVYSVTYMCDQGEINGEVNFWEDRDNDKFMSNYEFIFYPNECVMLILRPYPWLDDILFK